MSFVLDASVTLAWYFEEERTADSEVLLDRVAISGALVPLIWRYEVANGLLVAVRRGRIAADYRDASLADLDRFPITIDRTGIDGVAWAATLSVADRWALTVYDAAYVELAQRREMPLATRDRAMRIAAQSLSIELLG